MSRCPTSATLAYASRQLTEARGEDPAIAVVVKPRFGSSPNGFEHESFIYPGILTVISVGELDTKTGCLSQRELDALIAAIPKALGFGTG